MSDDTKPLPAPSHTDLMVTPEEIEESLGVGPVTRHFICTPEVADVIKQDLEDRALKAFERVEASEKNAARVMGVLAAFDEEDKKR